MQALDLAGQVFGKLVVQEFAGYRLVGNVQQKKRTWLCICECGKSTIVTTELLRSGKTTSCGCVGDSMGATNQFKHGLKTRTLPDKYYICWLNAKKRVFGDEPKWYTYKGKGMYDGWINDPEAFVSYIRSLPGYDIPGYSIDRIDNSKGYFPGNLRWADAKTQVHNRY